MITKSEQAALMEYMEFLLVKDFLEPIITRHVKDEDVVGACFDKIYGILGDVNTELDHIRSDKSVDKVNRTK